MMPFHSFALSPFAPLIHPYTNTLPSGQYVISVMSTRTAQCKLLIATSFCIKFLIFSWNFKVLNKTLDRRFMLRQVDVIRTNFYVFLFRTPQFSLQKRLQLDILRTADINHVNMVLFMKHVCVQYAAEPNLQICIRHSVWRI